MKIRTNLTIAALAALTMMSTVRAAEKGDTPDKLIAPVDLRCEYLKDPIGTDVLKPRLSWRMGERAKAGNLSRPEGDGPRGARAGQRSGKPERGLMQAAYRVLVASSADLLKQDKGDLWDSGKVVSDRSTQVEYAGKPLKARMQCFWKVRVWPFDAAQGEASGWSEPGLWSMGPLQPADWTSKWISMKGEPTDGLLGHPWLRRTFDLDSVVERAEIYVNTPSHYELYINGKRVGHEVLAPAHHQHRKRMLYNAYHVSSYLRKGRNCVALWMGPGWYQPCYGNPYKSPIVRVQLDMYTPKGTVTVGSDRDWRVHDSCISQIDIWAWNRMGGERWDDGKYVKEWNHVDFDDTKWAQAMEIPAPAVEQSWQGMPGSRVGEPIKPRKIYARNDKWVIDFGTTLTGWMRLGMSELKPGQNVRIDYSDLDDARLMHIKNKDGIQNFNQVDIYVAGEKREGVFQSKFNQHAFRYAFISGLSKEPSVDDAVAMSVYSDLEPAGSFRCSNELFNMIHQVTVKTSYSQNPVGALGGGEAREKLGYGDGGSFLTGFLYHMQSDAFYRKWLRDWCDNQKPDGFLGHTAPEYYRAGGGPSWGGQASELVKRLYLYYGDKRVIADVYPILQKYLDHLESNTQGDILRRFDPYHRMEKSRWAFLGDWTPPGAGPDKHGFVFETELQQEFFNNCYRILLWEQLATYADALANQDEVTRCRKRLATIHPLIHKTYWDPEKGTYKVTRQTYLTIALLARIMPDELRPAIFKQLEDDIVVAKKGHLDTGLQGTYMLLDLLTRENRNDLVALMMNQTTFPGWGFLIKERKVTTWPETWSGWGSQIIHVVGTPGAWFFEGLAGIRPDSKQPGYKSFVVRPGVVKSVDWVECSYQSPYGVIVSNWKREGDRLKMEVTVPPNSTATVYVPTANPGSVTESGNPIDKAGGVTRKADENGCAVFDVVSGTYLFETPTKE